MQMFYDNRKTQKLFNSGKEILKNFGLAVGKRVMQRLAELEAAQSREQLAFNPDYLVRPGETIEENIAHLGMTKAAFARHLGVPIGTLHRLISSEIPLSVEFAMKLESVTKIPAAFWNSLEANYRTRLERRMRSKARSPHVVRSLHATSAARHCSRCVASVQMRAWQSSMLNPLPAHPLMA